MAKANFQKNPAISVTRYREFMEPLVKLVDEVEKYADKRGVALSKSLGRANIAKEQLNKNIEIVRKSCYNDAQKIYFLRFFRARAAYSWFFTTNFIFREHAPINVINSNAKLMSKVMTLVKEAWTYDDTAEEMFELDMKGEVEEEQSYENVLVNCEDIITRDIFGHHFGQAMAGGGAALGWLRHQLKKLVWNPDAPISEFNNGEHDPINMNYSADSVLGQLNKLEERYNEMREQQFSMICLHETNTQRVYLKVDNEWAWIADERGYCDKTGDLMGHCGNRPSVATGDILLNLGRMFGNCYVPHLTFILNGGILGEMKGKHNSKPDKKYWPQIVKLIQDKRIFWLAGGGHRPENNFMLEDLDNVTRDELKEQRPELFDIELFVEKHTKDGAVIPLIMSDPQVAELIKILDVEYEIQNGTAFLTQKKKQTLEDAVHDLYNADLIDKHVEKDFDRALELVDGGGFDNEPHWYREKDWEEIIAEVFPKLYELVMKPLPKKRGKRAVHGRRKDQLLFLKNVRKIEKKGRQLTVLISEEMKDIIKRSVYDAYSDAPRSDAESALEAELGYGEGKTFGGFYLAGSSYDYTSKKYWVEAKVKDFLEDMLPVILGRKDLAREIENYSGNNIGGYVSRESYGDDPDLDADNLAYRVLDSISELPDKRTFEESDEDED
jgi:hypothetical protein